MRGRGASDDAHGPSRAADDCGLEQKQVRSGSYQFVAAVCVQQSTSQIARMTQAKIRDATRLRAGQCGAGYYSRDLGAGRGGVAEDLVELFGATLSYELLGRAVLAGRQVGRQANTQAGRLEAMAKRESFGRYYKELRLTRKRLSCWDGPGGRASAHFSTCGAGGFRLLLVVLVR